MNSIKSKVISGIFWQYAQRLSAQIVQFIVSLILARLLLPEDFGTIAIIGVFITISNLFIDSGFGNALIQKKNIDDIDCSSVFYLNLIIYIICNTILFSSIYCLVLWTFHLNSPSPSTSVTANSYGFYLCSKCHTSSQYGV